MSTEKPVPELANDGSESLLTRIVLDEIGGKNKAVHAYDAIIWRVRSGYLTLVFAGWGIVLSAVLVQDFDIASLQPLLLVGMLLLVSMGLALSGYAIDMNYVRRKFRVINDLDKLLELSFEWGDDTDRFVGEAKKYVRVSGDSGDKSYTGVPGYKSAALITAWVYLVPILFLTAGVCLYATYVLRAGAAAA